MRLIAMAVMALWVAGCDGKKPETTFADTQVQALKKAREAEQMVQQGAEKSQAEIRAATEGGGAGGGE